MRQKVNWSLIVALALPVVMVLAVALSIHWPGRLEKFQGQFVYCVSSNWSPNATYTIVNGRLQERAATLAVPAYVSTGTVSLLLHDIASNTTRDITLEEVQQFTLDPSTRSSVGFEIVHGSRSYDVFPFFFFGTGMDYGTVYIKGRRASRKLNVRIQPDGIYGRFEFIGWVKS